MPRAKRTAGAVIGVVLLASCGSGGDDPAPAGQSRSAGKTACDPVVVDPLDSRGNHHLLAGAPEPEYDVDPPTSGPHDAGDPVTGLQDSPLSKPLQVTVLEVGGIVVQFRPDLAASDRDRLAGLAGDKVVVAPNPALPAPVIATAWRRRLVCRSVDLPTVTRFVADRRGKGPG